MCDFINAHEDLIRITSFGEFRVVMKKVTRIMKEAHNVERKRRQTAWNKEVKSLQQGLRMQRPFFNIKRGGLRKKEIERREMMDKPEEGIVEVGRTHKKWMKSLSPETGSTS